MLDCLEKNAGTCGSKGEKTKIPALGRKIKEIFNFAAEHFSLLFLLKEEKIIKIKEE